MSDASEFCQIGLVWLGLGIGALSSQHPLYPLWIAQGRGVYPAGMLCQGVTSQQCGVDSVIQPRGTHRAL